MKATWRTTADEPASVALRRLHEKAAYRENKTAALTLVTSAPALADLAEAGAEMAALMREYAPTLSVRACRILDGWDVALAALRERLGARP